MRAEAEFELLKTLYLSSEMTFNHERHRVQLALIMQLAGITGNRPAALLAVCYRHIKVTLLPDPHGGERPRVLIEIIYKYTKGYLGEKDAFVFPSTPHSLLWLMIVAETNSGFRTSRMSRACCSILTSPCSRWSSPIKLSPPPNWLLQGNCSVCASLRDRNSWNCLSRRRCRRFLCSGDAKAP